MNAGDITLETGDIDWGVNEALADIDYNGTFEDSGIKVESSGLAGGVARGEEALTLLDSPSHRDQFLDEIFEVKAVVSFSMPSLNLHSNHFDLFPPSARGLPQNAFVRTQFHRDIQFRDIPIERWPGQPHLGQYRESARRCSNRN